MGLILIVINMISSILFSGLGKGFGINVVRNALADSLRDGGVSFEKWRKRLICELTMSIRKSMHLREKTYW